MCSQVYIVTKTSDRLQASIICLGILLICSATVLAGLYSTSEPSNHGVHGVKRHL